MVDVMKMDIVIMFTATQLVTVHYVVIVAMVIALIQLAQWPIVV